MKNWNRYIAGVVVLIAATFALVSLTSSRSVAQPAPADVAAVLGQSISTQVVTLKLEAQHGEPRIVTGKASFDRPVAAYWVSVVGTDIKFEKDMEKKINRQVFSVDPFAKIINGKDVEVSGKMGIRDGSGDFDDNYEGSITVAVTAILSR